MLIELQAQFTQTIYLITHVYYLLCSLLYLYIHLLSEELSWKSNVNYLATCPIKKEEGLSGRGLLKLLA